MKPQPVYDPLTHRFPRTIRETEDSRFRWWSSAYAEQEQEQRLREQLQDAPARGVRAGAVISLCLALGLLALDLLMLR